MTQHEAPAREQVPAPPVAGAARTDEADIGRKVMRGTAWVAASRWGTLLVTWPTTIALARILDPSDYGYLALVNVFTRFGRIVAEAGLVGTIVMGPSLSEEQYGRLHGWSLSFFLGVGAVIALLAVPIEHLYDTAGVRWILLALVSSFLFDGLTLVPTARMRRAVRFRELAVADAARTLVEAVTSLACAMSGFGYWSLIAGFLAGVAVNAIIVLRAAGMRPLKPTLNGVRDSLVSARRLLVASTTNFVATSSDAWVGGAVASAAALGGYTYMSGLARAPVEKMAGIITYGASSILGNAADEPERVGRAVLRLSRLTALVMFPVLVGVMLVADDLTLAVLGEKWRPYTSALRVLCLYFLLTSVTASLESAAVSVGRSRVLAENGVLLLLLLPAAFFVLGGAFGATGLASAWLVPLPLLLTRTLLAVGRSSGLPVSRLLGAFWHPLVAVGLMALAVLGVASMSAVNVLAPWTRLLVTSGTGAVIYGAVVLLLAREDIRWLRERLR